MNAVEEIRQAIGTLERLGTESTPGPWTHTDYEGVANSKRRLMAAGKFDHPMTRAEYLAPADAELIVTLHRTIDAQLAILHLAIEFASISPNRYTGVALALALAINGSAA